MSAARLAKCVLNRNVVQCVKTRSSHSLLSIRRSNNCSYVQSKRFLSTTQCLCKDTEDKNINEEPIATENSDIKKETIDIKTDQSETFNVSAGKNESPKSAIDKIVESQKIAKQLSNKKSKSPKSKLDVSAVKSESEKGTLDVSAEKSEPEKETLDVSTEIKEPEKETQNVAAEKNDSQKEVVNKAGKSKSKKKKVTKARKEDEVKVSEKDSKAKEAAESVEGSSSDSDSASSSDSDVERKPKPKLRVDRKLKAAAAEVAEFLPGDKKEIENDLIQKVMQEGTLNNDPRQKKGKKDAKKKNSAMSNKQVEKMLMDKTFFVEEPDEKDILAQRRAFLHKMKTVPIVQKLVESGDHHMTEDFGRPRQERRFDGGRDRRDQNNSVRRNMARLDNESRDGRNKEHYLDRKENAEFIDKKAIGPFEGEPFGFFQKCEHPQDTGKKYLYDIVAEEKKKKMVEYLPRNAFEEQILWTRQGRLWTFPIDNEAGWDEKNVSFQDHVFLDRQIQDFPQRGPIRHFMEIVTVGLSKNSYMTVQEKRDHIDWFRNYFKANEKVLEEQLGDMGKFTERVDQSSKLT